MVHNPNLHIYCTQTMSMDRGQEVHQRDISTLLMSEFQGPSAGYVQLSSAILFASLSVDLLRLGLRMCAIIFLNQILITKK